MSRILLAAAGVGLATASSMAELRYRVTPSSAIPGIPEGAYVGAVNDSGQLCGVVLNWPCGYYEGFVWDPVTHVTTRLGGLPPAQCGTDPRCFNNAGQVAGEFDQVGFLWSPQTGVVSIGVPAGNFAYTWVEGFNDLGQIVGVADGTTDAAFFWDPVMGMQTLPEPPGSLHSTVAWGVNNRSEVVGDGIYANGSGAFLWDPVNGYGSLGSAPNGAYPYVAWAINNHSQIAGSLSDWELFIWSPETGTRGVGRLPSQTWPVVYRIADDGTVIGLTTVATQVRYWVWHERWGFRWMEDVIEPCFHAVRDDQIRPGNLNNHGVLVGFIGRWGASGILTPYLPGDLDENRSVDLLDLTRLLAHFGQTGGATYADGDIEGCDGDVDLRDLTRLLSNFGETLP